MRLRRYAGTSDDAELRRLRHAVAEVETEVRLPGPDGDASLRDACWLAEEDGVIVGMTTVVRWMEDDGTEMFLLTGAVDPAHRGRGHGTAMLHRQEADVAAIEPESAHAVLGGNADEGRHDAQRLLLDNGYSCAFTVTVLSRPVGRDEGGLPRRLPAGLQVRPVAPEHHPLIHAAIRECFAGSRHGFKPLDFAAYRAGIRDTDLWVVAWDGDDVAGFVTSERRPNGSADSPWVAVRAPYRRQGLATVLLAHSLAAMRTHGIATATISTVAENANDTVALYEKAGYGVVRRMPRFRKAFPRSVGREDVR